MDSTLAAAAIGVSGTVIVGVAGFWANVRNTNKTAALTEQGQVTDRYTKAIEQLGSNEPVVRTGGIYALERVIRDSPPDHRNVMRVLAAFIRQHSPWTLEPQPSDDHVRRARADIQAAIRVIGNRVHLPGSDGKAAVLNLTGADLHNTDIDDSNLSQLWLHDANFTHASAPRAKFRGTHLRGANFTHANLKDADFTRAKDTDADLTGANFTDASAPGAKFRRAHLRGANFTRANLKGADFTDADLTGAHWPERVPFPKGWVSDSGSDRLKPASQHADAPGS